MTKKGVFAKHGKKIFWKWEAKHLTIQILYFIKHRYNDSKNNSSISCMLNLV